MDYGWQDEMLGEVIQMSDQNGRERGVSESRQYQPGDQVNGHVLGSDNVWHPLAPPAPPPPTVGEAADATAVALLKLIGSVLLLVALLFLLWVLL